MGRRKWKKIALQDYFGHSYISSNSYANNAWYHIKLIYDATTKKVDIIGTETDTGNTFYEVLNTDFELTDFSWLGVGFYDVPNYGSDWSPIRLDNVIIKVDGHSILTDATYGQLNNSVEIPVTATSELTTNDGIYSYQFIYAFDTTKLAYTG